MCWLTVTDEFQIDRIVSGQTRFHRKLIVFFMVKEGYLQSRIIREVTYSARQLSCDEQG